MLEAPFFVRLLARQLGDRGRNPSRFIAIDLSQSPDWAIVVQIILPHHSRVDAMDDHDVISQTQTDEDILIFDVSDEALERTTSTERQAFTWIYCTGAWQYCPA